MTNDVDVHPDRMEWRPDPTPAVLTTNGTLAATLVDRAAREPSAVAYYLPDEADGDGRLTVGELYRRADAAGAALADAGLGRGDRVCLCMDTSPELLAALYGVALVGAVPMLAEPPLTAGRRRLWLERVRHMVEVAGPTVLVCDEGLREAAEEELAPLGVTVLSPPFGDGTLAKPVLEADPEEPAFIQFTSGTTSAAKGIVHSHRSLLAASDAIGRGIPFHRDDVVVSWLPLHHDMGLVGCTLSTFLHDLPTVLFKPLSFGLRPARWLHLVHRYRGNVSPAPNFAYQLVMATAKEADLEGLDLGSWRVAFNGAEVVDAGTVRDFQRVTGPYGFPPESLRPCYGMAELGLAATFAPPDTLPRIERLSRSALADGRPMGPPASDADAQEFVSSGVPVPGTKIRITGEDGRDLPDGRAGKVLVNSTSMMNGYLGVPLEEVVRDGWLETGDLGFVLDGELFVTGRAKDLIIIAGRNYHPQPFEAAATTVDGVRASGAAAVGRYDAATGTERLVIVVETKFHDDEEQAGRIRTEVERRVSERTGVSPGQVVTVKPGRLPRTSSGKMQRHLVAASLAQAG
jgi:fatty-acyl-CoA synthase